MPVVLESTATPPACPPRRAGASQGGWFETRHGSFQVAESALEIEADFWSRALRAHAKDSRYYQVIEETLSAQFDHRYFVLKNARTGAVAIQPFFFIDQDITAGLPARLRTGVARLRQWWPRFLTLRMMMIGCAAGEGQLDSSEHWVVEALHEAIEKYAPRARASIVLLKDFPASYRAALAPFSSNGYRRVPSMPAAKLDLTFGTFEDYMQHKLGKVFRKNLRRKFKDASVFPALEMEVINDASAIVDEIFPLYFQTYLRSEFKFEELTREYFCELGRRMPDRVRFFVWRQNGRIIAFNLCLVHEGTLYDLDVGLDYSVALDLHLYFVTWRDMVQWALAQGLQTYHTGPLNYDPKLHLKLDLAPQDLYARHTSRWINPIFKIAIAYLEPTRHDPVIRRFANAHEL